MVNTTQQASFPDISLRGLSGQSINHSVTKPKMKTVLNQAFLKLDGEMARSKRNNTQTCLRPTLDGARIDRIFQN